MKEAEESIDMEDDGDNSEDDKQWDTADNGVQQKQMGLASSERSDARVLRRRQPFQHQVSVLTDLAPDCGWLPEVRQQIVQWQGGPHRARRRWAAQLRLTVLVPRLPTTLLAAAGLSRRPRSACRPYPVTLGSHPPRAGLLQ